MKWLLVGLSGLLCAVLACLLAAGIAALCVEWFRISDFEGAAGYCVVFIALGGSVIGFVTGVVTTLVVMGGQGNFARGFGISVALLLAAAALAIGIAWLLGDIPPKLGGDTLELLVELQSPPGWKLPKKAMRGGFFIRLESVSHASVVRASEYGQIHWAGTREADGRVIIPASIYVFTSTGKRRISAAFEKTTALNFALPLPAHPKAEFEQWSAWLPAESEPGRSQGFRYRFRVMRYPRWRAAVEEDLERRIAAIRDKALAMPDDAPLESWLRLQDLPDDPNHLTVQERTQRLHDVFTKRAEELPALLNHPDREIAQRALLALMNLDGMPASAEAPLRSLAPRFAEDLRKLREHNSSVSPDPPDTEEIFQFVQRWLDAWERLPENGERTPPDLSPILAELALWGDNDAVKPIQIVLDDSRDHWKRMENAAP